MPPAAVPLLARLARSEGTPDLQEMAVRALGTVQQPIALDLLLGITAVRKGLLGVRLPPKSPVYLAALRALGEGFPHDPRARNALAAARRSKDPEIAEAARAGGVT
jgi:HEAT repeat protein